MLSAPTPTPAFRAELTAADGVPALRRAGPRALTHGALRAFAAAAVLMTVGTRPAGAQATPDARSRVASEVAEAAAAAEAAASRVQELDRVRREADEARARLTSYIASLTGRPASSAVLDSLATMQRSLALLERRLEWIRERASFRELESRLERASASPPGWFGVEVQTLATSSAQSDGRTLVSADYPRVVSVEPGSPAAHAGLLAGDRLIAIRGTDLRGQALALRSVLQPGMRVPVQVERDGVRRDLTVMITRRPSNFSPGTRVRLYAVSPEARAQAAMQSERSVVAAVAAATQLVPQPDLTQSLTATTERLSQALSSSPVTYLLRSSQNVLPVAGAELMRMTEALRASLGVSGGVYVISVAPRTPAEWAGLREGDVILSADGVALDSPVDFFRVVREQSDGVVRLELVRESRSASTELRW